MEEPRTTAAIVSDLLQFLEDHEWVYSYDRRHNENWYSCSECGNRREEDHKPDCRWLALRREAEAFVAVERELEESGRHKIENLNAALVPESVCRECVAAVKRAEEAEDEIERLRAEAARTLEV
jgi:hypothetical protein